MKKLTLITTLCVYAVAAVAKPSTGHTIKVYSVKASTQDSTSSTTSSSETERTQNENIDEMKLNVDKTNWHDLRMRCAKQNES